jgi:hypothetical protein
MVGLNGADRGSGRGPCTVQVSFSPEFDKEDSDGVTEHGTVDGASSRYAEPDADGVTPVFRTVHVSS